MGVQSRWVNVVLEMEPKALYMLASSLQIHTATRSNSELNPPLKPRAQVSQYDKGSENWQFKETKF